MIRAQLLQAHGVLPHAPWLSFLHQWSADRLAARMKRPALLIPAYGLAALGTAVAYLHFSFGIVAGFDGIAKGRYFLGPVLSILSALAVVALWRVWLIGARLWRYGAYINALPRDGRYDAAGVVSAVIALVGFGAIARPIYRTVEVIVFGILLTPAVVLATVALVRGRSHSQTNASDTAVDESAATTCNAELRLADLPGLVCGTSIALLGIFYLVPRPISGWGPCKWTVFYPLYQDLWPVERPLVFDACDDGAGMVWVIGVSLSLVCLVSGYLAAYIGKNANAVRGAASAAIAVAVVLTALSIERLGSPHPIYIGWVRSFIVGVLIVVGAGWLGYVGGKRAMLFRRPARTTATA